MMTVLDNPCCAERVEYEDKWNTVRLSEYEDQRADMLTGRVRKNRQAGADDDRARQPVLR